MAYSQNNLSTGVTGMLRPTPKVTALVPSYNHGRYIRERIESIMGQSHTEIELVVIDDRSPDNSNDVILGLQAEHDFTYIQNVRNSGTPFSAWEAICEIATGDYIWICESDDVAEPEFLETAIDGFKEHPDAVMFYSNSHIIDEEGKIIDHTNSYFHDIWKETRWDTDFVADGVNELVQYQLRGQTVPNMSSALFTTTAFKKSFSPFIKRFELTGDWLFVGEIMKCGKVIFNHQTLNNFRKHEVTSRVRVKSARSQAEFIHTKYRLFRGTDQSASKLPILLSSDVIRFLYEPATWFSVIQAALQISFFETLKLGASLAVSTCKNRRLVTQYIERYKHAKGGL
jgi:glycosyltransferase involved in cell wall biosynthesis